MTRSLGESAVQELKQLACRSNGMGEGNLHGPLSTKDALLSDHGRWLWEPAELESTGV